MRTLTGTLPHAAGRPQSGTVHFTALASLQSADIPLPARVVAALDSAGSFSVELLEDFAYLAEFRLHRGGVAPARFRLPATLPGVVNLVDLSDAALDSSAKARLDSAGYVLDGEGRRVLGGGLGVQEYDDADQPRPAGYISVLWIWTGDGAAPDPDNAVPTRDFVLEAGA